ncbi:MAG TPA: hypothetical protein VN775_09860 [Opitutaceae bacterium]|nr:hypothetical protein [Opitutaceae bacterium]
MTPLPAVSQFNKDEVMAMLEFCIDLDNQDDRANPMARSIYKMRADRYAGWELVDDSRVRYANAIHLPVADRANPVLNGFPPFGSAWTLWRNAQAAKRGENVYALAFRGTVFSHAPSVVEDALVTTVAGRHGLELPAGRFLNVTFAAQPRAEVHEGFAYGIFGQLFDKEFGALARVEQKVPPGSTLIITGHSQGAALATLAHAFLVYAAQEGRFGIADMRLSLRSYVFAQPKPGNTQFSQDFAGITGGGAASFTFNNTIDPVPMLPPTHGFLFGAFEDSPRVNNPGWEAVRMINNAANSISRALGGFSERSLAGKISQLKKKSDDGLFLARQLPAVPNAKPAAGVSQNYTAAGNVIPLVGLHNGSAYYDNPGDADDAFIQHHATTYRRLLETMYGYPATTEDTPGLVEPPVIAVAD